MRCLGRSRELQQAKAERFQTWGAAPCEPTSEPIFPRTLETLDKKTKLTSDDLLLLNLLLIDNRNFLHAKCRLLRLPLPVMRL
ncbi:hypothetical protein JTE90_016005 [Oedothorax gibbosus]|uniref:Uncharacterized protein n=1 Tax=Oedothorax gibbosus TaxID=931172 RepID=A0AAV6VRB5_9ARAC|nr:hypothetical protein JTE90_016005 [Oedothorax gibbosus]